MKAVMCFMVEFWDVDRQPQPPIKPHSEPYVDFEWPLQGWCIDLPQVCRTSASAVPFESCTSHKKECLYSVSNVGGSDQPWCLQCICSF